jgi:PAS domain S-box-containing protein
MYTQLRKSGIEILGDIPWGSHFCQFYETKKDLLELLVPYFKAGLENNEYCLWVTCDPMTTEEAFLALKKAVPEFETYVEKKSIEILPHMDWFFVTGKFNTQQLNEAWIRKLDEALVKGYDGMRINGNETWLREGDWDNFMKYEHGLNKILSERRIIGLCTYPLSYSNGKMMLDVAHAHERIISKRKGEWEVLETPLPIQAQSKLNKLNQEIRKIKKRPSNLSSILSYGIAVLSVAVALIILLMSTPQLFNDGSYVSLFLCAVILSSWFGGVRPGLLAVVLSLLAFDYFFLSPLNSFSIEANEIPRLLFFLIPAIFVVWLTATQKNIINLFRRTRGVLEWTVQKLDQSNTALREENEERKKAEDELRRAYQRLSYHVENTPLAVIERDKDLNITRWSGQAEKIFGWKASEVLGKNMYDRDFPIVYRDDKEKVAEVDYELTNGLIDRNLILNRNYTKDGKVIYCEWYNSVLRDEQGNVVTILSLTHDVTERKEAEEKLNTSYEQIRSLSEHLTNVREVERKHIAREIHDELGQELTVLKMDVGSLVKKLPLTDDIMRKRLASFSGLIDNIVQSVRRIASELRPSLLDDLGLTAAIAWHMEEFEKRSGIKSHFKEPKDEWILPDPVKINLFRIVQEATTNIGRHSNATEVHVNLEHNDHSIVLRVFDNGVGFNAETICKGNTLGILGMRERASIVGGKLEIKTAPGNGTEIFVSVPAAVNK